MVSQSISVCAAFTVALVVAASCGNHDQSDDMARRKREGAAQLQELRTSFGNVVKAWPATDATPSKACPDESIASRAGAKPVLLVMASWELVEDLVNGHDRPMDAHATSMTHKLLLGLNRGELSDVGAARELLARRPYVAIWRATELVRPHSIDAEHHESGSTKGTLVIFDVTSGSALCWFAAQAGTQREIAYKTRQSVESQIVANADTAVHVDLLEQLHKSIEAQLAQASKVLTVGPLSYIQ